MINFNIFAKEFFIEFYLFVILIKYRLKTFYVSNFIYFKFKNMIHRMDIIMLAIKLLVLSMLMVTTKVKQ